MAKKNTAKTTASRSTSRDSGADSQPNMVPNSGARPSELSTNYAELDNAALMELAYAREIKVGPDTKPEQLIAELEEQDRKASESAVTGNPVKKGGVFYWLKNPSYVDDETVLPAGLHQFSKEQERLAKHEGVETFESDVPSVNLFKIAEWAKVDPTRYADNDAGLLEALVTVHE